MKLLLKLSVLLFVFLLSATTAQAETPAGQLAGMVEQLRNNPADKGLRVQIIKLAQGLRPNLAVPKEAIRFEGRGQFRFKKAKSVQDYLEAAKEYEQAAQLAPWVDGYYADLCMIYEKAQKFAEAKNNCEYALQATGDPALAADIERRIAGLEIGIEQNEQQAALAGEFVAVPGGCFQMGDNFGEGGSDEKPVHEVCVDGFSIGKYEVTQGQWQKIMGSNPASFKKGDNYPVEKVSWDDAQEFIKRLNGQTGKKYRLPTEAEWEYAARSGGKREKYAGGDNVDSVAWYGSNSDSSTHPVGTKAANGLGIYDMSGNVWEWCQDWYDGSYYGSSPRSNPTGPATGSHRVLRGGSWPRRPANVRAANRSRAPPDSRNHSLGFRLLLPPGQ